MVPPTSTTSAVSLRGPPLAQEARKLAPLIELVGPELNVLMGKLTACSHVMSVPSLEVRKSGHSSWSCWTESTKPATTCDAYSSNEALRMVAFSLSSSPGLSSAPRLLYTIPADEIGSGM